MKITTIILGILTLILLIISFLKGQNLPLIGLKAGSKLFLNTLPLIVLAFAIGGLIQVLVPKEFIANWLSEKSGMKGIIVGSLAGAVTPSTGPFVIYPIAVSLYKSGAGMGVVVAYILGGFFWNIQGIPFSLAFLGKEIFIAKFISCLSFPILGGLIAHFIFK